MTDTVEYSKSEDGSKLIKTETPEVVPKVTEKSVADLKNEKSKNLAMIGAYEREILKLQDKNTAIDFDLTKAAELNVSDVAEIVVPDPVIEVTP